MLTFYRKRGFMPKLYIETSVVSYLTSNLSSNLRVAAHQFATREMWPHLNQYDVFVSDIVVSEAGKGDALLAQKRLKAMSGFSVLPVTDLAGELAESFLSQKAILESCPEEMLGDEHD